jgi:anti-sigma regulatory factor (Ser/Thr protein kinase)
MSEVELHLPPDAAHVGLVRLVVCAAARQAGMSEDRVEDLRIAVSEAAATAIGGTRPAGERVRLRFGPSEGGFEVVVDAGELDLPDPGLELAAWEDDRELGLSLIRNLADEFEVDRSGTHHQLRFLMTLEAVTEDGETAQVGA